MWNSLQLSLTLIIFTRLVVNETLVYELKLSDFQVELKQYGVRPLPKRKMVVKLKEIYNYTHKGKTANITEMVAGVVADSKYSAKVSTFSINIFYSYFKHYFTYCRYRLITI